MQLGLFVSGYPDESLFSIAARYHELLGYNSYQSTTADLFGKKFISATIDLPQHVDALSSRIPWDGWSSHEIVSNHTAFSYYAYFIETSQRQRLYTAMCSTGGESTYGVIGSMAQNIKSSSALRYCPVCVKTDRADFGEAYWHRTHQMPGVLICPTHGVRLVDSTVSRRLQRTRNAFVTLENFLQTQRVKWLPVENDDPRLQAIADDSKYLIDSMARLPDLSALQVKLQALCRERGWLGIDGKLKTKTINHLWGIRYPREFCRQLQCGLELIGSLQYTVQKLLFHANPNIAPLVVILFLRMMGYSLKSFADYETDSSTHQIPVSQPCINPVCPEFETMHGTSTAFKKNDDLCFIVTCHTCDMQYAKYQITNAVRYRRWGRLWDEEIRRAVTRSEESLRGIAHRMRVDTHTIRKHAERLGVEHHWSTTEKKQKNANMAVLLDEKRSEWLSLRSKNPFSTRKQLRVLDAALWTWLYRNDKAWLEANSPRRQRLSPKKYRRNWKERDSQLCLDLMMCVRGMRNEPGKPIRITRAELIRRVDGGEVFQVNASEKLPKVVRLLRRLSESRTHYINRRVEWVTEQFIQEGHEPKQWEVVRRAGIRDEFVDEVREALTRAVEKARQS